jgi:hypothetical protein
MGWVVNNFDKIELTREKSGNYSDRNNSPSDIILLSKKINGSYYVAEAVPDTKKKNLYIVSAYKNKS